MIKVEGLNMERLVAGGPFGGFTAPAEKRAELDVLLTALEQARAA